MLITITSGAVKYKGKFYAKDEKVNVKKEIGEQLIKDKLAVLPYCEDTEDYTENQNDYTQNTEPLDDDDSKDDDDDEKE